MNYWKIAPSVIEDIFVKEKIQAKILSPLKYEGGMSEIKSKTNIVQQLIHRGYLTSDTKDFYKIPNEEIRDSLQILL